MTLDLVMSPWSMSNMKLLIVYLWFKFSCNKSESVYEEIVLGIKQPTKYKWHKYEGSCNAAISQTCLEINEIFMLGRLE